MQLQDALECHRGTAHAGIVNDCRIEIDWIQADGFEECDAESLLGSADGILVPGGFDYRGVEGKIAAANYARMHRVPFFGLCLGMQCAVIEFARGVCGMADAHSAEFDRDTPYPVIDLMPEQKSVEDFGGTMRLGSILAECGRILAAKQWLEVSERHRHRYELNNEFRDRLGRHGMVMSGVSPDGRLVEIIELSDHPWFVGTQFHPEFRSRPNKPHPLFTAFVEAALEHSKRKRA